MVYRTPGSLHCIPCLSVNLTSVELSPTLGLTDATLEESLRIPHLSPKIAWPSRQPGEMDGRWLKASLSQQTSHILKESHFQTGSVGMQTQSPGSCTFHPLHAGSFAARWAGPVYVGLTLVHFVLVHENGSCL